MKKIKVLIVDDSLTSGNFIKKVLWNYEDFEVIGLSRNGREVIEYLEKLVIDIVVMDTKVDFPDFKIVQEIMAYTPIPILLLSSPGVLRGEPSKSIFKGLAKGALEVMAKPEVGSSASAIKDFIEKVRLFSQVKVITHLAGRKEKRKFIPPVERKVNLRPSVIAIASSIGGPQALHYIFSRLPSNFPASLLVAQHISDGFTDSLVEWLEGAGNIKVKIAGNFDELAPSIALVSPSNYHMCVNKDRKIVLNSSASDKEICPSADKLFESVASIYGKEAIGVVLTGMGEDGAKGLKIIKNAGGRTIAQSEESCVVFGMPQASINTGGVEIILPLSEIPQKIIDLVVGDD